MVQRVKDSLAGRMSQYVNRRRRAQSDKGLFAEALSNKGTTEKAGTRAKPVARNSQSTSKRASSNRGRVQRGHTPTRSNAAYAKKHITGVQAQRLAKYAPVIQQAARKYGVPVELVCAVILQESGGNYKAVSHCGARGLMQLMPATARGLGVANSFDPVQNINGGTKYLRQLLNRFDGSVALALAGYNAGEGNVEKYGRRIPPFKETRAYVPNVLKYANTLWSIMRRPVRRIAVNPAIHHRTIFTPSRKV